MRRVTRGPIVILTFDPAFRPWLTDYLPELAALDDKQFPAIGDYETWLGRVHIEPVLVSADCSDGFLYAFWRRPEAYLDPRICSGSSSFWLLSNLEAGLRQLEQDLASGAWQERYAPLLGRDTYDAGYRLITAA